MENNNNKGGRKPLFCLSTSKNTDYEIPNALKGKFVRNGMDYCFMPVIDSGLGAVQLKFWKG